MATTLYIRNATPGTWEASARYSTKDAGRGVTPGAELFEGGGAMWALSETIGTGAGTARTVTSVAGPTAGIMIGTTTSRSMPLSDPLAADVTISGTITFNMCGLEAAMAANATFRVAIYRVDSEGALTLIVNSTRGTELGTALARSTWTASPTSTAMKKGDRLLAILMFDDATSTTMGDANTLTYQLNGANASTADSNIAFTETLTFFTVPGEATNYYLRDTASDITPGSATAKKLSQTQGGVAIEAVHTTVVGPLVFPGDQWTVSAGGADIEWYTPPLNAFTLNGRCMASLFNDTAVLESVSTPFDSLTVEIAVVDADGTNPVIWARSYTSTTKSASPKDHHLLGADLSVAQGKRLRLRIFQDDMRPEGDAVAGTNRTIRYNYSGDAISNTLLQFTQTITEAPAAGTVTKQPFVTTQAVHRAAHY